MPGRGDELFGKTLLHQAYWAWKAARQQAPQGVSALHW